MIHLPILALCHSHLSNEYSIAMTEHIPKLKVKPLKPLEFSWEEALNCGEIIVRAFHDEMWPWWGAKYRIIPSYQSLNWISDPRYRLSEWIQRQKRYAKLVRTWARECHLEILESGRLAHGLYYDDRLIGYSLWTLPTHLIKENDIKMGREAPPNSNLIERLAFKLFSMWKTFQYSLGDIWDFFGDEEHPLDNLRYVEYIDDPEDAGDLPASTPEALKSLVQLGAKNIGKVLYRPIDMCYLDYMVVDPDYQHRGYGKVFLQSTINDITDCPTPFEYNGKKIYGPQKLFLKTTSRGYRFYKSMGFNETVPGASFENVHLIRDR